MNSPTGSGRQLRFFESIDSTHSFACSRVRAGDLRFAGAIAEQQTAGRGRFGRTWVSPPGSSLALSLVLWDYADAPHPELIGLAAGVASARACRCGVAWPNDLVRGGKKLGGILTELVAGPDGSRVPVIGIGVNVRPFDYPPEIEQRATSLDFDISPSQLAAAIVAELTQMPEPVSWQALQAVWTEVDSTPGRKYQLPDGRTGLALRVDDSAHLVVEVDGEEIQVPSAEALFGIPHRFCPF